MDGWKVTAARVTNSRRPDPTYRNCSTPLISQPNSISQAAGLPTLCSHEIQVLCEHPNSMVHCALQIAPFLLTTRNLPLPVRFIPSAELPRSAAHWILS